VLTESVWEQLDKSRDLFVTPGPEQCLMLTSGAGLERLATRLDVENGGDGKTRRLLFARSERLRVDANGHTVLPERLALLAALGDEICVVGVGDHFEIWDAARWQRYSGGDSPVKEIRQTSATQLSMPVSK